MKQGKRLWLTIGTAVAILALGVPHAFAQRASAVVILVCDISSIGTSQHFGSARGKEPFRFEASSGTPAEIIRALSVAETCADAQGVLEGEDPNPNCSTSAAPNKYIASCDLTAPIPPDN